MTTKCPFCDLPSNRIVLTDRYAIAFGDAYPVTDGHSLVIPRRHVEDYWGLTSEEREACHELLVALRERIVAADTTVTGFNIGLNVGRSAGQTVFHCHFHLIPRRERDVPDPRGGLRNIIPGGGAYEAGN
jgi:diadenosine tetraphosphate (Ap4A) HIT family hydrolase